MRRSKMVGMIVMVVMLFSTIGVLAGSTSDVISGGGSRGEITLYAGNAIIEAYTKPVGSWNSGHAQTRCLYYSPVDGSAQKTSWDYGVRMVNGYYSYTDAISFVYAGESSHGLDGVVKYLYCSYN